MRRSLAVRFPLDWPPAARRWSVLVITAGAAVLLVTLALGGPWRAADLALFSGLMATGVAVSIGQRLFGEPESSLQEAQVDLQSVWIFACALLMSPAYAALSAVAMEVIAPQSTRRFGPINRAFNASSLALAASASAAVAHWANAALSPLRLTALVATGGPLPSLHLLAGMLLAAASFLAVNAATVAEILHRRHGVRRLRALGGLPGVAHEAAVQCTGALVALSWGITPVMGLLTLPTLALLQRSLLHSQLLQAARTDPKTGLANVTYWRRIAESRLESAAAGGLPLAVALVDLDNFKRLNDVHGHLAGDAVLRNVADALVTHSRPGDLVGRFGGEEFAVLLPGSPARGAGEVAERLRSAIARIHESAEDAPIPVTASVGIAVLGEHGRTLDSLMLAADRALYAAKADGRNVVRLAAV